MPGIGSTLRDARIRARIDVAEVEAQTKIRAKYLRAMENEEWELLPGPVYIKSFLRTYGDYLGLDSRLLVEEYKRDFEAPGEHELRPIASLRREREREPRPPRRLAPPPWMAIAAVLVAVVVVLFVIGENTGTKSKNGQLAGVHAGVHHHKHHAARKRTIPVTPPKPRKVSLALVPTAPVYVCLLNGAHKTLIPGVVYDAGQKIPTETAVVFFLTLGNNNEVMKVDGKPVTVAASAGPISYRITAAGASTVPPGTQPTCR